VGGEGRLRKPLKKNTRKERVGETCPLVSFIPIASKRAVEPKFLDSSLVRICLVRTKRDPKETPERRKMILII